MGLAVWLPPPPHLIQQNSGTKLTMGKDGIAPAVHATQGLNDSDYLVTTKTQSAFTGQSARSWIEQQVSSGNVRQVYDRAKSEGISAASLDAIMGWAAGTSNGWAVANGLPQFAVGANYLPQDMVAVVHEGERIIPKADNQRLFELLERPTSAPDSTAIVELKAEIRELKAMMAELLSALLDVTHHSNADAASKIVDAIERTGTQSDWERRNRPALA